MSIYTSVVPLSHLNVEMVSVGFVWSYAKLAEDTKVPYLILNTSVVVLLIYCINR
jgi:hypothetical protein